MQGYIAIIQPPDRSGDYAVVFPDVPGCASCGETFASAVEAGREALSLHLGSMRADGEALPVARSYETIVADPDWTEERQGAMLPLITPRALTGERVRVNITIDKGLLRQADEAAEARGLTRSGLIEDALAATIGA